MKLHSQQHRSPRGVTPTSWAWRIPLSVALLGLLTSFAFAQLRVVVSIEPYREPVERLLGDLGTVDVLLPPGASPHGFDPTPRDVARLAEADLVVANGGLDPWFLDINDALGTPRPVFMALDAVGIDDAIEGSDHDHDHDEAGHDDEHHDDERHDEAGHEEADHEEADHEEAAHDDHTAVEEHARAHDGDVNPHVWLDPLRMDRVVAALAERLIELAGDDGEAVRSAAEAYRSDLAVLDAEIAAELAPYAGAPFIPFHDGWPYFAERYGLDLVAEIEPFPGREPSARVLAQLIELIRSSGARAIFTETQLDDRSARVLADEAGVDLGVLDPIGGVEGREGYLAMMRFNARVVSEVFGAEEAAPR